MAGSDKMSRQELLAARDRVQQQIDVLGGPMKGSIHDSNRVQLIGQLQAILEGIEQDLEQYA